MKKVKAELTKVIAIVLIVVAVALVGAALLQSDLFKGTVITVGKERGSNYLVIDGKKKYCPYNDCRYFVGENTEGDKYQVDKQGDMLFCPDTGCIIPQGRDYNYCDEDPTDEDCVDRLPCAKTDWTGWKRQECSRPECTTALYDDGFMCWWKCENPNQPTGTSCYTGNRTSQGVLIK